MSLVTEPAPRCAIQILALACLTLPVMADESNANISGAGASPARAGASRHSSARATAMMSANDRRVHTAIAVFRGDKDNFASVRVATPQQTANISRTGRSKVIILDANNCNDSSLPAQSNKVASLQGTGMPASMPDDAVTIPGVYAVGTVRVNNLANLEALVNVAALAIEIICLIVGGIKLILAFLQPVFSKKLLFLGLASITFGLSAPGCVNWLIASARDANLFS